MPFDSNGVFSLTPGYLAVTGETILPTNHNPPLEDIATQGLSSVLVRDGRAPMTGNLNMGNFKVTNLLAGTSSTDGVNKNQLDSVNTALSSTIAASLKGYLFGLTLSNNVTDPTNDIDIAAGAAASDGATAVVMTLAAALTKRLDAAWAVGTGNGGLDTGSIANTTYHVWLIQRSDTGVVDALFSASATAPTMPTNYDRKRRIGSIVRAGATILGFVQNGDKFDFKVQRADVSGVTNPGITAVLRTLSVPTGIIVEADITVAMLSTTTVTVYSFSATDPATTDTAPGGVFDLALATLSTAGTYYAVTKKRVTTNTSAQIRTRFGVSDANLSFSIITFGWIDTRGRT